MDPSISIPPDPAAIDQGSTPLGVGVEEQVPIPLIDADVDDYSPTAYRGGKDKNRSASPRPGRFTGPAAGIAGGFIVLLQCGFILTGTTSNVWLDAALLTIGFALVGYGLWTWGRSLGWHIGLRIGAIGLLTIFYLTLAGFEIQMDLVGQQPSLPSSPSPQAASNPPAALPQQEPVAAPAAADQNKPALHAKPKRRTVARQGPCNLGKSGGFAKPVSPGCGPVPMTMSNANYSKYAASFGPRAHVPFAVLLATYREDAFELSRQLCAPAKSLHWARACPRVSGSSVSSSGFQNLEIDAERVSQVCLASRGGVVTSTLAYRNCSPAFLFSSFPPNDSDYRSSVDGLHCYYDAWESPDGISFQNALKRAGLPCTFVGHGYHTGNERLFANGDGEEIGAITVVIGDPVGRQY